MTDLVVDVLITNVTTKATPALLHWNWHILLSYCVKSNELCEILFQNLNTDMVTNKKIIKMAGTWMDVHALIPHDGESEPEVLGYCWWRRAGPEWCDEHLLLISGGSSLPARTAHTGPQPPGEEETHWVKNKTQIDVCF